MEKITIKVWQLAKINHAQMSIFEEEDQDAEYVNRRVVKNYERSIDNVLAKITNDKVKQLEILDICAHHLFNTVDTTFKPICDDLRKKGYIISEEA